MKYLPTGHGSFCCFINTFVHVVIYSYLVLTTTCPNTKKYFGWWKSFLPPFQFFQFLLIYGHSAQLLFKNECNYPMAPIYFISVLAVVFICILVIELVSYSNDRENEPSLTLLLQKFINPKSNKTTTKHDDDKKPIEDYGETKDSSWNARSKNLDVIFNYDSFIRILRTRREKSKAE